MLSHAYPKYPFVRTLINTQAMILDLRSKMEENKSKETPGKTK
jgi:hypothetical protein